MYCEAAIIIQLVFHLIHSPFQEAAVPLSLIDGLPSTARRRGFGTIRSKKTRHNQSVERINLQK